jgi:hypothetical protein
VQFCSIGFLHKATFCMAEKKLKQLGIWKQD